MENNKTQIARDLPNKKITVIREFNSPLAKVWAAWTESHLLDQWWAPRPWKAVTKTMDFRVGGIWLYSMQGPDGAISWSRLDIEMIDTLKCFIGLCTFCDEQGNRNVDFPSMRWNVQFQSIGTGTKIIVELSFENDADMSKLVAMGFEGGFTMGLNNLEELLAK
ncbi:MAG: SRPBCC domain-containing protein [Bacteroidota bacterium]